MARTRAAWWYPRGLELKDVYELLWVPTSYPRSVSTDHSPTFVTLVNFTIFSVDFSFAFLFHSFTPGSSARVSSQRLCCHYPWCTGQRYEHASFWSWSRASTCLLLAWSIPLSLSLGLLFYFYIRVSFFLLYIKGPANYAFFHRINALQTLELLSFPSFPSIFTEKPQISELALPIGYSFQLQPSSFYAVFTPKVRNIALHISISIRRPNACLFNAVFLSFGDPHVRPASYCAYKIGFPSRQLVVESN